MWQHRLARIVYAVLGTVFAGLGIVALVRPSIVVSAANDNALTAHLTREQGAEALFVGLMTWWCAFQGRERRPIHFMLLLFAFLFAAIHWAEYVHGRRQIVSPLVNSIPFLMLLVVTPFDGRWERAARST